MGTAPTNIGRNASAAVHRARGLDVRRLRRVFRGRRKRIATTLTAVAGEHRDQALALISSDHANSRPDGLTWREHLAVWEAIRGFV